MQRDDRSELKKLLIISDELDEYIGLINNFKDEFIIIVTSLADIEKKIPSVQVNNRENFLIIISDNFFNPQIQQQIQNTLLSTINLENPFFLRIKKKIDISKINKNLENVQHCFFYTIPDLTKHTDAPSNFLFFIKIVFQRIQDLTRLDNYIINSFRTIIDSEILNIQKQEIETLYQELERLSKVDYLTKVLNRKAFFEAMDAERKRTVRNATLKNELLCNLHEDTENHEPSTPPEQNDVPRNYLNYYGKFSCIMIDLDHFKKINDTHGHLVGDKVLKEIGKLLNSNKIFRDNDIIGRYGGEEFIIVLPGADAHTAKFPAERFRKEVKTITFKGYKGQSFNIFVSIGISEFKLSDNSNEDLINRTDQALYYAKRNGRDQTIIYEDMFDE